MTRTNFPPRYTGWAADKHVCGLYYVIPSGRQYLPQVRLDSHTTISPVCFNTTLRQVFGNTTANVISEARYTFPLYDGVAVAGYTISYAGKVLNGVVKQKEVARQTFQAAVDRGETAGLLEALPAGIFGTTIGNVPATTEVHVEIQYCGALIHDAALDGLRFTLPTSIAPRYGEYPGQVLHGSTTPPGGISITVDVEMGSSNIRKVQSPTHPIAVSLGSTSGSAEAAFAPSKASATLTLGSTELAADFVLQLLIDDISKPQAIVEQHPSLPDRAIMATLVPRFNLLPHSPEIVFIADQSGSMQGPKNVALKAALVVFLKSLPLGVRFNICAFGSTFKFLWPQSLAYNEQHLNDALQFVDTLRAQYGGTEMLQPITAAFDQRLGDLPLEIMLLSDGEIWGEDHLFGYINSNIHQEKVDARVFALGIGTDVSSTLIEGVARAGKGFAQFVTQNEETDQKVVRMLKGALYPHTTDYSIEVHYDRRQTRGEVQDEECFEIIERVNDCLKISEQPTAEPTLQSSTTSPQPPGSFFDADANLDEPTRKLGADRYAHLPQIATPNLLQAPSTIPPLFPFNRTSVYLLLSESSPTDPISSVTLRAKSPQGPLELSIPITAREMGSTVHTLAARKAVQDLEEGRGWLQAATVEGKSVKETFPSRFDEIVEREAVRLGERYQVAGKWCSFVAVEDKKNHAEKIATPAWQPAPELSLQDASARVGGQVRSRLVAQSQSTPVSKRKGTYDETRRNRLMTSSQSQAYRRMAPSAALCAPRQASSFGAAPAPPSQFSVNSLFGAASSAPAPSGGSRGGLFARAGGLFGFGNASPGSQTAMPAMTIDRCCAVMEDLRDQNMVSSNDDNTGFGLFDPSSASNPALAQQAHYPLSPQAAWRSSSPSTTLGQMQQQQQQMQRAQVRQQQQSTQHAGPGFSFNSNGGNHALRDYQMQLMLLEQQKKDRLLIARQQPPTVQAAALTPPAHPIDTATMAQYQNEMASAASMPLLDEADEPQARVEGAARRSMRRSRMTLESPSEVPTAPADVLHSIIALQTFDGFWRWDADVFALLGSQPTYDPQFGSQDLMTTAIVVTFLEIKMSDRKGVWEMVVQKARSWIWFRIVEQGAVVTGGAEAVNGLVERAKALL
ncbi:hypothetical protein B0A48_03501 [Cryoendolithus antarcticus]|uniref:VIT domain-containing protein n=1 Tax=Cryoendolithus antarcticus TaxID=1507870 RepID=A0A1V8TKE0_9PEZI|nr:hypothetical protein B0A48_03501 [Cryoendolithus antarcticus]